MKPFITALALLLLLTNCRSSVGSFVGSVTTIPPGREFELGNNQHGAFAAQVQNTGAVLVTVSQRQPNGLTTPLGKLKPKDRQKFQFGDGTTAVFGNATAQSAELSLSLTGDTNLRMGYAAK